MPPGCGTCICVCTDASSRFETLGLSCVPLCRSKTRASRGSDGRGELHGGDSEARRRISPIGSQRSVREESISQATGHWPTACGLFGGRARVGVRGGHFLG